MISPPTLSLDAETANLVSPPVIAVDFVPSQPRVEPKVFWFASDLLLIGLVIGLSVAVGVSMIRSYQHQQARDRVAAGLTAAAAVFQDYLREHRTAPASAGPGIVPAGLAPSLAEVDWTSPTPAGGSYSWTKLAPGEVDRTSHIVGMITITAFPPSQPFTLSAADLLEIDRRIDDGNLATGDFRVGFNGWPVLLVRSPR